MITIGSLFSGVGGLELALETVTGGKTVWQAEQDEYCLKILAKHWPSAKRYTDVREITSEAGKTDIVCGGFPCQPHSTNGKRKGTSDDRWLWPEFQRIINELRPRIVFIENVVGLRTSGLGEVLRGLADIGYDAEWDCYSAAEVGAPHQRKRIFIYAYPNGNGLETDTNQKKLCGASCNHERTRQFGMLGLEKLRQGLWVREARPVGMGDGPASKLDKLRLKACGNAVVPLQAGTAFMDLWYRANHVVSK